MDRRRRRALRTVGLPAAVAPLVIALSTATPAAAHEGPPPTLPALRTAPGQTLHPNWSRWVLPVDRYRLTGRFGDVSGLWSTVHTGLDFAAPEGTPIHAVAAGIVVSTGYDGSYGEKTVVRLHDGTTLWYCHQSRYAVHPGQRVLPGQLIGFIGTTGNTTGPHLHLEVHPGGGDPVDPFKALVAHGLRP